MAIHLLPGDAPYTTSVILQPGESGSFDVRFRPETVRTYTGKIKITVVDNLFEENKIQLFGEGFQVVFMIIIIDMS